MHAVIIANAPGFEAGPFAAAIAAADLVVAADGGGNALHAAGLVPDVAIGDLDSLAPAALAAFEAAGAEVLRHPADKDETDLELALLLAVARGAASIDVLGAFGGRWDQSFASVALLALPELAGRRVRLLDAAQEARLLRGGESLALDGCPGETVSLIPLGDAAEGITTRGLQYALSGATLRLERSRGISNVIAEAPAGVSLGEGLLLVVRRWGQAAG